MASGPQHNKLTERVRHWTAPILERLATFCVRLGIHPDGITISGLLITALACIPLANGQFHLAAMILLIGLPLDALDGAVARASGRTDPFGSVLDSALDRYADGFILIAFSYYFAVQDRPLWMLVAMLALLGSISVSYVRARAAGTDVNVTASVGSFTRMERLIVVLAILLIPALLEVGILLLAVGTNATALQRLWFVREQLTQQGK